MNNFLLNYKNIIWKIKILKLSKLKLFKKALNNNNKVKIIK